MIRKLLSIFVLILVTASSHAVNINMGNGSQTITCPGPHNFYDSGGNGGSYNNSESFTLTIYPSTAGQCLSVTFSAFATESCCDNLKIYNGSSTASPLMGTYAGTTLPPTITSTGGPLTFVFTSDGSIVNTGWAATISCVSCPPPPPPGITMGNGTSTVTCPGPVNFYDSGGSGGNYNNSESYTMTVYPSTAGQCLSVSFTSFATESCCDNLKVYDGSSSAGTLLGTFAGTTLPPTLTSTGGPLTFVFTSDGSVVNTGWVAAISCTACPPPPAYYLMNSTNVTFTSCPTTYTLFYDSGGPTGTYANSENFTKTFTAPSGYCLRFTFDAAFQTEACCDRLYIFDGPNGSSPSLGTYSSTIGPGIVTSSGSSITFSFTSDGSVVYSGWTATISCIPACSGMPNGGTGQATGGGCLGTASVSLSSFGSTSGCGITYQWQSGPSATGPWTNVAGATLDNLTVPTSTNTYYHLLVACGSNTATGTSILAATSSAVVTCNLSTYTASAIPYNFDVFVGTTCPSTDDVIYTSIAMMGFQFCYTGNAYWGGYISSNGSFIFDAVPCYPNVYYNQNAAAGIGTGYSITQAAPSSVSVTSLPQNAINGPWQDINPALGGIIRYGTLGVSPNRRFVVSYENVPMYSCGTSSPTTYFTGQIKLFETNNVIEIHVGNKQLCPTWNAGAAIMGLTSFDGLTYIPPVNMTAHNYPTNWTMVTTAYRFQSPCAQSGGPCNVLPINFKNFYGERVEKVNKLFWESAEEKNIKTFIVERSTDAENFNEIARVAPNNSPSKYKYDDHFAAPGTLNYYRITAVENTGERKSTHIVPLGSAVNEVVTSGIFPNPVENTFYMSVDSKVSTELIIHLYDSYGKLIKTYNKSVNGGAVQLQLNAEDIAPGVYMLEVTTSNNEFVSKQKLIKLGRSVSNE